jgi:hypothetical protein
VSAYLLRGLVPLPMLDLAQQLANARMQRLLEEQSAMLEGMCTLGSHETQALNASQALARTGPVSVDADGRPVEDA